MGDNHSLVEVASSMIKNRTIHRLDSDDALLKHAEAIDSTGFKEFHVNESWFRRRYSTAFEQVVDRLRSGGRWVSDNKELIRPGELDKLHIWAKERVGSEDLRQSSVYHFLDEDPGRFSPTATMEVKLLADETYYEALRTLLENTSCTVAGPQFDRANLVYSATTPDREISISDSGLRVVEIGECQLPYDRLATLPVEDVLNLRESTDFRNLRATLHDVRNGGLFSEEKIRESLARCLHFLDRYSRDTSAEWRDVIIRHAEKNKRFRKLQFWVLEIPKPVGAAIVVGIGIAKGAAALGADVPAVVRPLVDAPGSWLMGGAAIAAAGFYLRGVIHSTRPDRFTFPAWTYPVEVDTVHGIIKGKIPNGYETVS